MLAPTLCGADALRVLPPRIPPLRPEPRAEKLLRNQVRYLVEAAPPVEIPNELEYAIRPLAGTATACAICLKFTACENAEAARATAVRILADLTRTHLTGGGRTASGRPWGHHWQSAFWAWEATFAAWLLWPELPAPLRQAVVHMAVDEADRFADLPAPASEFLDTKAEENSWNSLILVWASEALPDHPQREKWRHRALEYMISAFATRADRESSRMVDGRPLRQWVRGANAHSDYTVENHGFVHPDYMTTITMNLTNALVYRLLERPLPQAVRHNAAQVYDVLKFLTQPDGSLLYPNGTDWNLHVLGHTWNLHILMERLLGDRQAGALAGAALATLEKMQARTPSGRIFVPAEMTSYPGMEQHYGMLVGSGLMAARLWPPPPESKPLDTVWKELEGARLFDDAHFFVARAAGAINSFAWGLRIMGLTMPFAEDPMVHPMNHSYIGLLGEMEGPTDRPARIGVGSLALERTLARDPVTVRTVVPGSESGAMHVTASVTRSGVGQVFSFTALPSGQSVYMERFSGEGGPVRGGLVSLLEEQNWVYGRGERQIEQGQPAWVNVDGRLGFAVAGGGGVKLIRDYRNRLLVLNDSPPRNQTAVIVTLPGATAAQTRAFAGRPFRAAVRHPDVAAAVVDGWVVATNFSPHPTRADLEWSGRTLSIAISGYSTRVLPHQLR